MCPASFFLWDTTPTNARTIKQGHVIISKSIRTVSLSPQNRGPLIVNRTTPLHVMNSTSVSGLTNNAGQILPLQQQDPGFFHPRRANAFAQEAVERLRSASLEQNRKWMPPTVPAIVRKNPPPYRKGSTSQKICNADLWSQIVLQERNATDGRTILQAVCDVVAPTD